jgi:uncharacterized protein (TIGR00369 family)
LTIPELKKTSELLPFNELLGVRIMRRHSDGVTIEVKIRQELLNSAGAVHGGVLASMADTATGIALHHHFGGRRPITTTDLKINYLPDHAGKDHCALTSCPRGKDARCRARGAIR